MTDIGDNPPPGVHSRLFTRRQFIAVGAAGAAAAAGFGAHAYHAESNRLKLEKLTIPLPGLRTPFTAAIVADVHLPRSPLEPACILDELSRLKPAAVFFVGDGFNSAKNHLPPFAELVKSLPAPLGTFVTMGNWEHNSGADLEVIARAVKGARARMLCNEAAVIDVDGPVSIVGLDDWLAGRPDYTLAENASHAAPLIVLSHCPVVFDTLSASVNRGFVQLSGHTHGGQVVPFGIVFFTPPGSGEYVSGMYRKNRGTLYVTRGIGYTGLKMRLGAPPELTLISFEPS